MSDVWGSEARETVARALAAVDGDGPEAASGYLGRADAVLEALTPHAAETFRAGKLLALSVRLNDDALAWRKAHDRLRAAVLALAQDWDAMESAGDTAAGWFADELRALAGGQP